MKIQHKVQCFIIDNDIAGQRIDNFLLTRLQSVPKSKIYRIIRKGEVRINSSRITPEYKIQTSDIIRIPPIWMTEKHKNIISVKLDKVAALTDRILYEDEHLLVLNKPSGMAVHGGSGVLFSIIEVLRALRPEVRCWELAHRLDRETSGVLLIAKKRSALRALHQQLRLKQMKKQYLALVKGQWPTNLTVIHTPLLKNILQSGSRIVKIGKNHKDAETHFKIEERFSNSTLVTARPITGRTHQIRVHTQYAKYPIACDKRYGDFVFDKQLTIYGLKRLFLHACSLMFIHPANNKKLLINAPLDQDLKNCLIRLRKQCNDN